MSVDTERELFHLNFIKPGEIQDFLSAQTYRPAITRAYDVIHELNNIPLQQLSTVPIRQGGTPHFSENGFPCIKSKQTRGILLSEKGHETVDPTHSKNKAIVHLEREDIVITRQGAGTIGRASIYLSNERSYITDSLFKISPNHAICDACYLVSFLRTNVGQRLIEKGVYGSTGQLNLSSSHIKMLPVFNVSMIAQKYVGNKIRQAEKMRAWSKILATKLDSFFLDYDLDDTGPIQLVSKASPQLLTHILTATTYKYEYVKNQENVRSQSSTKGIYDYLKSIANGYDEREDVEDGLPYVKVAHVRPGLIELNECSNVSYSSMNEASPKQVPKLGDLLLTRKGSFGIAAVVMEDENFLCSSEVFCCKPKNAALMPVLAWFLNSKAGQLQFKQFSTGTTMPGINQENLANIVIPDFTYWDVSKFNDIYKNFYLADRLSKALTTAAKIYVEEIIDGHLSEAEIVSAQQALDAGDDSLDRALLERMTAEGIDSEGEPLFDDIDQLYDLLDQAKQALDADDTMAEA
ncbi:restriction endonuclease subunit S [Shewanella intestini]|uniref:Type I restriction modification DNA specificity domain-containing protein n=1 Tax=Shewanella intestini TaxID=2017544 RepID=A0ABS5I387_9GAMM|nr:MULTISPECIES: restriction endonuclease subunit S [Shewanella]MBR9728283.1 hypothetical protein [Shewanella intestini]MRG35748.1 hypothetical protein [Shewanella sp. XMDDZSB0408]